MFNAIFYKLLPRNTYFLSLEQRKRRWRGFRLTAVKFEGTCFVLEYALILSSIPWNVSVLVFKDHLYTTSDSDGQLKINSLLPLKSGSKGFVSRHHFYDVTSSAQPIRSFLLSYVQLINMCETEKILCLEYFYFFTMWLGAVQHAIFHMILGSESIPSFS